MIPVILCMVCEARGPEQIYFRIEKPEPGAYKMTAHCKCGNSEVCFEKALPEEVHQMGLSGGFDFANTKRFKKL